LRYAQPAAAQDLSEGLCDLLGRHTVFERSLDG
jgi:hypothetical protein